jgi:hypothetical protein
MIFYCPQEVAGVSQSHNETTPHSRLSQVCLRAETCVGTAPKSEHQRFSSIEVMLVHHQSIGWDGRRGLVQLEDVRMISCFRSRMRCVPQSENRFVSAQSECSYRSSNPSARKGRCGAYTSPRLTTHPERHSRVGF